MKYLFLFLALFGLAVYVLFDSGTLVFKSETLQMTGLVERAAYKPEFHEERLQPYFNKLVSKFSK